MRAPSPQITGHPTLLPCSHSHSPLLLPGPCSCPCLTSCPPFSLGGSLQQSLRPARNPRSNPDSPTGGRGWERPPPGQVQPVSMPSGLPVVTYFLWVWAENGQSTPELARVDPGWVLSSLSWSRVCHEAGVCDEGLFLFFSRRMTEGQQLRMCGQPGNRQRGNDFTLKGSIGPGVGWVGETGRRRLLCGPLNIKAERP